MSSNLLRTSNFVLGAFVLGMSVVGSGCGSDDDDDNATGGTGGSKGGSAGTAGKGGSAGSSAGKGGSAGSSAGKGGNAGKGGGAGTSAAGETSGGAAGGGASGEGGGGGAPDCNFFRNCCNNGTITYLNASCGYVPFAYCPGECRQEGECTEDISLAQTPLVLCEGGDPGTGGAAGSAGSGN